MTSKSPDPVIGIGGGSPARDATGPSGRLENSFDAAPINILIVDDEPKNLTVLETVLDDPSYRLVRASTAEEALLALIVEEFALIILDIRMPGMTGFELAQMIKERKKTALVPIIFLTAYYNEDQHVLEGYGSGAVDFLHKPVNPTILRSKVSIFAELHRRNREISIANQSLLAEVAERRQVEEQLRELNETLELRVKQRTKALQEKELRLRQAADAARLTYVEVDFLHREVRKAENFTAVMGYTSPPDEQADEASSPGLLLWHVAPQDRQRVADALNVFAASRSAGKLDYRVIGDDQIERWIESEWFVEYTTDGKPQRTFLTNLDVSDRKRAQEQLRESEERFRQLADSMPQMVWTARADGYLDYYNARWWEFTGFGPEQYGDLTNWEPIIHPEDRKDCVAAWRESVRLGETYRMEFRLWDRTTKRYCWYLGRAIPLRDVDNRIVKWIGTCTDIDEQKRSQEDLRRANQALEQFAFAASHDLQEPLRNVAVYTQLLQKRHGAVLNAEADEFMQVIVEGAQRMSRLVSDLLTYTKVASSEREPSGTVDAEKAFVEVLKGLHRAVEECQATVTHDKLPTVAVKNVHLQQLLQNLIGNALKYRRDGESPRVHVSAVPEDQHWRFSIHDNGIGIDPEYQKQVFGIFRRLHANVGKYTGTGIGLAICERIVEHYGGRIWVESEPGQGATFYFTIPASGGM